MIDLLNIKIWAIEANFFDRVYPVAFKLLNEGKSIDILKNIVGKKAGIFPNEHYDLDKKFYREKSSNGKNIAYIPIIGGLTKHGQLCAYGMHDYINSINAANDDDQIDSIVLEVDSPGGSVDGTQDFSHTILTSKKELGIFGDGIVASAAYWISTPSKFIMANANNDTEFGSIGTLYVHENWSSYIEKEIGDVRIIRAPQSVDKARLNPIEPLSADLEKEVVAELKQITDTFISVVKNGRGDKLNVGDENIFTGKMYPAKQALKMGMIDAIGTRQDAIDMAGKLAYKAEKISLNTNNQNSMKLANVMKLFGGSGKESTEDLSAEDKEALENAEQKLTEMEQHNTDLQAEVARLTTVNEDQAKDIDRLNGQVSEQTKTIAVKETEISELNKKLEEAPAGQSTTVIPDENEFKNEEKSESFETSVDREAQAKRKEIYG